MAFPRFPLRRVALAAMAAAAAAVPLGAHALITVGGTSGNSSGLPLGPGDTSLPNTFAWIGAGAAGSLAVDGGSALQLGGLNFGAGATGNGTGLVTGVGTRVDLLGDGERLMIGNYGSGQLTVSGGARLDTSGNQAPCMVQFHYCDTFVGSAAGAVGGLTVTGNGTVARFGQNLFIGVPALATIPVNGYESGIPGGTTLATMQVLDGAQLITDRAQIGARQWSSGNTGQERSVSNVTIAGAGTRWSLVGGQQWDGVTGAPTVFGANLITGNDRNAVANLDVRDGAELRVEGVAGIYNAIGLSTDRGRSDMRVSGAGSAVTFIGDAGVLQVGRSLGSASMTVQDGAVVSGVWYTSVGRDGSFGELALDGAATRWLANGTASAAANGNANVAVFDIGRNGTGRVSVTNGARIEITATDARANGPQLSLGRDAASSGSLSIGSGGVVRLSAASVAPDSVGEAWNPWVRIGREGNGSLNISGGGKLLVEGNAVSTIANTRRTSLYIGGSSDTSIGGRGVASISGAGSELRVSGADAYIAVGNGPQASGNLSMDNQASLTTTILAVGNFGGTGVARLDNARIELSGQYTGSGSYGAAMVIGAGDGAVGNMNASNGSVIRISNTTATGNNGGGFALGGSSTASGGDGSLTLNNAAVILDMPNNNAGASIGRSGSGLLRMSNGASVDIGGNALFVGRLSGSDGTVIATGGSTITAGWVGVGRNRVNGVDSDGGTGTMVLNGATLNAADIVIGTNGFLGGTAGSINASGSITNYGIFSPGNSPGRFNINGNYIAGAGSRLVLEVMSDGHAGFNIDEVMFGAAGSVDLAAMQVEFRFLGNTDPNAFLASGQFNIDSFVQQADASGAFHALADTAYDGVQFSARADDYSITDFSYSASGGASFSALPVPEPGAWLLMLAGLVALPAWRRRVAASARA